MGHFFKSHSIRCFYTLSALTILLTIYPKRLDQSYNPTYITSRDKERFTQQEDYLQRSRHIIQEGARLIKDEPSFFSLLAYLSRERASLAQDHKTECFEDFGLRRDLQERGSHCVLLKDVYEQCGKEVFSWMNESLEQMISMKQGSFKILKKQYQLEESFLGCKSTLSFEIFNPKQVEKWSDFSEKSNLEAYVPLGVLEKQEIGEPLSKKEQKEIDQAEKQIKALYPNENEAHDMSFVLQMMDWDGVAISAAECYLIKATLFIQMNNKTYPLTRYNMLLPVSHAEVRERLGVVLLHQDVSLIQETLEEAEDVFNGIMKWDGIHLEDLQNQMALLTYVLVHNMRDTRGSAAENEWLTHAIYKALQVEVLSDPNKLQDLEAFARPMLSDFVKAYRNIVSLSLSEK